MKMGDRAELPSFDSKKAWISSPTPSPWKLLGTIAPFLPRDSFLYIEGTDFDRHAAALYRRNACSPLWKIVPHSLQPNPLSFHMPATASVLAQVSTFMKINPSAKWGHHLEIYAADGILVSWHDADTGWPVLLCSGFSADLVQQLGRILGCEFSR
jgi:hypothetical protein